MQNTFVENLIKIIYFLNGPDFIMHHRIEKEFNDTWKNLCYCYTKILFEYRNILCIRIKVILRHQTRVILCDVCIIRTLKYKLS